MLARRKPTLAVTCGKVRQRLKGYPIKTADVVMKRPTTKRHTSD